MRRSNIAGDDQAEATDDQPTGEKTFADTIDKDDPHKVEKLAKAGRDTDTAEASE